MCAEHVICGDPLYVITKFGENQSKDKRMFNHARTRTRVLARMRSVREQEKHLARTTCGDL
jgi:hypothetical protein